MRESCVTTMTIIYKEPEKYNETVILDTLRHSLSKDDFEDIHGSVIWWKSVIINTKDKHVVKVGIPSENMHTINMTKDILGNMDGVAAILPGLSRDCTIEQT